MSKSIAVVFSGYSSLMVSGCIFEIQNNYPNMGAVCGGLATMGALMAFLEAMPEITNRATQTSDLSERPNQNFKQKSTSPNP